MGSQPPTLWTRARDRFLVKAMLRPWETVKRLLCLLVLLGFIVFNSFTAPWHEEMATVRVVRPDRYQLYVKTDSGRQFSHSITNSKAKILYKELGVPGARRKIRWRGRIYRRVHRVEREDGGWLRL